MAELATSVQENESLSSGLPALGRPKHFTAHERFEIEQSVNTWLAKNKELSVTQIDMGITGGGGLTTLGYIVVIWTTPQQNVQGERTLKIFEDTPHSSNSHQYPRLDEQLDKYLDDHKDTEVIKSATACSGDYGKVTFAIAEAVLLEKLITPDIE